MDALHLLIRTRPRGTPLLLRVGLLGLVCLAPGCGLFYRNKHVGTHFVLRSNHDPEFLIDAGKVIERIYEGYDDVFEVERGELGRTTILFKGNGNESVVDASYSPQLLGYYLPFFNLISVDTIPAWTREPETLQQILLHEISHHFLITAYPPASDACWLNEGLAGNLEMTLFDEERFEYPLLNPPLLKIAHAVVTNSANAVSLPDFIRMGWRGFHEEGTKEVHYALAWSVVYFLLTEYLDADLPLRTRVRQLYETDPEEICRLEGRWKAFVISLHLTEKLEELAGLRPGANDKDEDSGGDGEATASTKLTACWAIDQLGTQRYLDRRRALRALERGFELEDPEARRHAYLAFARLSADLSATSSRADLTDIRGVMERGADRIDRVIADPDSPPELRQQLVATVARNLPRQQRWLPVFIRLLDAPESEIRVEAARGLGRALVKRTVINPSFWRAGSPSERRKEIDEWEDWWSSQPIEARQ